MLLVSLYYFVLNFLFTNNCHKLGNIGKHLCALLATNILHQDLANYDIRWKMWTPLIPSCNSCNIVEIFESYRRHLKIWSWPWWYNFPWIRENRQALKANFFFCSWLYWIKFFLVVKYLEISCNHIGCKRKSERSIVDLVLHFLLWN